MSDPVMTPKYDISLEEERDIALKRLQRICDVSLIFCLIQTYSFKFLYKIKLHIFVGKIYKRDIALKRLQRICDMSFTLKIKFLGIMHIRHCVSYCIKYIREMLL